MRGSAHHLQILLVPTLTQYEEGLENDSDEKVGSFFIRGHVATVGDLLNFTRSRIFSLKRIFHSVRKFGAFDEDSLVVKEGEKVPTASPRHTLVRLLVKSSDFQKKLLSKGGGFTYTWYV